MISLALSVAAFLFLAWVAIMFGIPLIIAVVYAVGYVLFLPLAIVMKIIGKGVIWIDATFNRTQPAGRKA